MNPTKCLLAISLACVASVTSARAENRDTHSRADLGDQGDWIGLLPTGRFDHASIYDPVRDRMIVFGGIDYTVSNRNDTWALTLSDDPTWQLLSPTGTPPSGRAGHTAIYDPVRDRMIVFGGFDGARLNDVWALSLSGVPAWQLISTSGTPPTGRSAHTAIYDPIGDRMVVFGGHTGTIQNDVWALSLSAAPTWTPLVTAGVQPEARSAHLAILDSARNRMLIFGGAIQGGTYPNDVWALTLTGSPSWSELAPSGNAPEGGSAAVAIYDPDLDRMVLFGGGADFAPSPNETRALTLTGSPAWTTLSPSGTAPEAKIANSAIYDPVRDRLVLFGGAISETSNEVSALSLTGSPVWTTLFHNSPSRGSHTSIYDPVRDRVVLFGGYVGAEHPTDVYGLDLPGSTSWSLVSTSGSTPVGRENHSAIYDPVRDRMLVFGGTDGSVRFNDVPALNLAGTPTWSTLTVLGAPPSPRHGHTAIYDPARDRMVVFGGSDGTGYRNDVWALNLSGSPAWVQLTPSGTPPDRRSDHTAIYDPNQDRMIVFAGTGPYGGIGGPQLFSDVWSLSLSGSPAWSALAPAGGPQPLRMRHTAIYDPIRKRMVVFGGDMDFEFYNDVRALSLTGAPEWTTLAPSGTPPTPVRRHTSTYDPVRDRMIVLGFAERQNYNDIFALTWDFQVNEVPLPEFATQPHLQARPNPISSSSLIHYELPGDGRVSLEVLDIQGRLVQSLRQGVHAAGRHIVTFDRRDSRGRLLPAGIYLVRLRTREDAVTTRVVVLH